MWQFYEKIIFFDLIISVSLKTITFVSHLLKFYYFFLCHADRCDEVKTIIISNFTKVLDIGMMCHTLPSTQICGSIEVAIFSRSGRPFFLRVNYTWVRTIFKKEAIVFGRSPNVASPEDKVSLFWCSKSPDPR